MHVGISPKEICPGLFELERKYNVAFELQTRPDARACIWMYWGRRIQRQTATTLILLLPIKYLSRDQLFPFKASKASTPSFGWGPTEKFPHICGLSGTWPVSSLRMLQVNPCSRTASICWSRGQAHAISNSVASCLNVLRTKDCTSLRYAGSGCHKHISTAASTGGWIPCAASAQFISSHTSTIRVRMVWQVWSVA